MDSSEIRERYLKFFEDKGHKRISPAPLVLENDPTTLFTSAGMQPLIPYLKGKPHELGKRLVDSQPSLRLQDIEEVGDSCHTTFFEMLGNWSLGDYFKKEQLVWIWQFFTKELGIDEKKLYVSVFKGNKDVPRDEESIEVWKGLGIPKERIVEYGVDKNWWSNSGTPEEMLPGDIGGPDSEVFYDFGTPHNLAYGEKCHPNCDCGRFLEIGNSVFIQYEKQVDGSLKELPQKNVDFGGGLERITAAVNNDPDIFKIDLLKPTMDAVVKTYFAGIFDNDLEYPTNAKIFENQIEPEKYKERVQRSVRIITDHLRASVFLIKNGVLPSNKEAGYVLRRLLRRAAVKIEPLKTGIVTTPDFDRVCESVAHTYGGIYFDFSKDIDEIKRVVKEEMGKFSKTLHEGLGVVDRIKKVDGKVAFDLYQTYGFPLEITEELFREKGQEIDRHEFEQEFEKHQELSRTASAGMFKGGLVDNSEDVTRLHTTTHLLHAALRKVLGESVSQKGSNITAERLRFDFSHPNKLTEIEIEKVESLLNEQIQKDLPVTHETMSLDQAVKSGALHFFAEKYGEKVKVYTIGPTSPRLRGASFFSKEVCGGPHVTHTGEIGHVTIKKQEKIGSNLMRIYASIE